MARNPLFFIMQFIIPSMLFVVLSYLSYWVDKAAAPARVGLSITAILISISHDNAMTKYSPAVRYSTWMSTFTLGTLCFTTVTILEYGVLNFSGQLATPFKAALAKVKADIKAKHL